MSHNITAPMRGQENGRTMVQNRWKRVSKITMVIGLGAMLAASAAPAVGPCEQIRVACQGAGFVQGGVNEGAGLQLDCIAPLMQGAGQRHKASKPLPQVSPEIVAACKAQNPGFGQPRGLASTPSESMPTAAPAATPSMSVRPSPGSTGRPNIVFVLTDDLAWNLVQYMPHVLQMQKDGVTFANYFVTDSLCCPSRSSIFTCRYPHSTGVFRNTGAEAATWRS